MELSQQQIEGITVISVSGRLTANQAETFKHEMDNIIPLNKCFVLDLTNLEYIDSTGLGAFVYLLQKLSTVGSTLKLCALHPKVKVVFSITRANKIFDIHDTLEQAVASFQK